MLSYYPTNTRKDLVGHSFNLSGGRKKIKEFSYASTDRIGKGFSSVVYKGTNDVTNEVVAIKAIDMKGVKDEISRQMLDCQIEALTMLKHECVLKCFEVVREPAYCYIITEYCNQGDLSGLLKKKKRLTEEETMKILRHIVSGFLEIGEKGFLHRDLKLANIFMHDNVAKIADFGFAKKNRFSSEKEKYNVGSPLYMSPEALKKNIYSLKNDIWSIGVMTYELLHGQTPWECKTEKELIDKMTRIPVRFRQSLKISEPMKNFIRKCLEVDERKRMSLPDLKSWLNGETPNSSVVPETHPLGVRQENIPPKLNLSHKPISNIDKLSYGNSETTGRATSRSYKQNENKENKNGRTSGLGGALPKSIIEKNNAILVNEINTFRLMYKLMEKVKKTLPAEERVIKLLGSEVIKRVTDLKNCCDNREECYGLGITDKYFEERHNPNIKKYKSVVSEYYKKYTTEIKSEGVPSLLTLKKQLKNFLSARIGLLESEDELLIGYWTVELLEINRDTSKEKLDEIIEPKIKLNRSYMDCRIKEAMA